MGKKLDLTGQRFGRLVVLHEGEPHYTSGGNRKVTWVCQCDCGNVVTVVTNDLRTNHTKSCGCLNLETASNNLRKARTKYNKYKFIDNYCVLYSSKNEEIIIDKDDFEKVNKYCWFIHHGGYVSARLKDGTNRHILIHKLIMDDLDNNYCIDHENGNKLDNRKSNLRICTVSQNNMNRELMGNNTSGVSGVYWSKRDSIWIATININQKRKEICRSVSFEDACKARQEAEDKYYKEYSYKNSREMEKS